MKISAVILTKNKGKKIQRALKSVDFCDEIIIIDDYSTDNTLKKLKTQNSKVKIFKRELNLDFSQQRNFGMGKCKNNWILFIDADEEVSNELQKEIISLFHNSSDKPPLKSPPYQGGEKGEVAYYIKRRDFFWDKELKYGEIRKIRQMGLIRLIKKNSGKWKGKVHEIYKLKTQSSNVKTLENYLNHYPHPNLKDFLEKINFYSTLRAKELAEQKRKTNILEIIFFPLGKFVYTYFFKLGFLDGPPGFVYAFFMSFHSFLVRTKLYQYSKIANNYDEML